MARRRPNILDSFNSIVPAKRILRDEGPCKQLLPLVVRYIKFIYSWSVHPARRRRTHNITVTVRRVHSSSTSESDSLPVSSTCKAKRWYESQHRRLNNEGEKIFPRFMRTDRRYAPLCTAFCSASPNYKIASYGPAQYQHPPSTFLDPPL